MEGLFDQLKYYASFHLIDGDIAICKYINIFKLESNMLQVISRYPDLFVWFIRSCGVVTNHPNTHRILELVDKDGHSFGSFCACYRAVYRSLI